MKIETLRIECNKLRAVLDLTGRGSVKRLASEIRASYGSLVMALSGQRKGRASEKLLKKVHSHLSKKTNRLKVH